MHYLEIISETGAHLGSTYFDGDSYADADIAVANWAADNGYCLEVGGITYEVEWAD